MTFHIDIVQAVVVVLIFGGIGFFAFQEHRGHARHNEKLWECIRSDHPGKSYAELREIYDKHPERIESRIFWYRFPNKR